MKYWPICLICPPFILFVIFDILFCSNEYSKNKRRGYRSPMDRS